MNFFASSNQHQLHFENIELIHILMPFVGAPFQLNLSFEKHELLRLLMNSVESLF